MNNQLKIVSSSLKLKTYLKKEDNVAFEEKSIILGCDKSTEKRVILGKYTYICHQMDNLEANKYNKISEYIMSNSEFEFELLVYNATFSNISASDQF